MALNLSRLEKLSDADLHKEIKSINLKKKRIKDFNKHYDEILPIYEKKFSNLKNRINELNKFFKDNVRIETIEKDHMIFLTRKVKDYYFKKEIFEKEYLKELQEIMELFKECYGIRTELIYDQSFNDPYSFGENDDKPKFSIFPDYDFVTENVPQAVWSSVNSQTDEDREYFKQYSQRSYKLFNKIHEIRLKADNWKFNTKVLNTTVRSSKFSSDIYTLRAVPSKEHYNYLKIITEDCDKALRKIELILRARKKGKEKMENVGYVYVLSNETYPNTYKIGSTYGLPEERAEELTGTGHLTPFKVVNSIKIQSAEYYEINVHKLLRKYRVKRGREFFKVELSKIKDCLKQVSVLSEKGKKKVEYKTLKNKIKI